MGLIFGRPEDKIQLQSHYIIVATGAFMAGYTRMTYSLAILLMETSQSIEIFVPMVVAIVVSNGTGYLITRSLYERATRGKQMPIIIDSVPEDNKKMIAGQIMSQKVVTLKNVETVANLMTALKTSHHAFPILNHLGNLVGVMPRNFILTILENRGFYMNTSI